ncbi:MAG: DUF2247 family protein [Clostridium sp.]|nr:DUF2247 family protein [Clostridium sp.]
MSEVVDYFDDVLKLYIAEEDEVEEMISDLASREAEMDIKMINSKWIFAIIYDAYVYLSDEIYSVIEDVYVEWEYPEEISNLIGYMPCDNGRNIDEELNQYISANKRFLASPIF